MYLIIRRDFEYFKDVEFYFLKQNFKFNKFPPIVTLKSKLKINFSSTSAANKKKITQQRVAALTKVQIKSKSA